MIPEFDANGYLPPGIHSTTLDEIRSRFGKNAWRQELIDSLDHVMELARPVGGIKVFVNGSFVTNEALPADVDVVVVVGDTFDPHAQNSERMYEAGNRFTMHLFVVQESQTANLNFWLEFFGYDRANTPRGLLEPL